MKQSWEMTRAEFAEKIGIEAAKRHAKDQPESWYRAQSDRIHGQIIRRALTLGFPVPDEVLKEVGETNQEKGA